MLMASAENTAWVGVTAAPCQAQLKVRPHSLSRPRGAFFAAELVLLGAAVLQTAWRGHSLGTLILVAFCALFFHINNLDRSVVSSESMPFWIDLLESVSFGFLASGLLFQIFPGLVPRFDVALAAGLLTVLLPVILRLFLQRLVSRGKFVEQILIVGTGDLPAKLQRALDRGMGHSKRNTQMLSLSDSLTDRGRAVDVTELKTLVERDQISRVVIAELGAESRERLAAALLDSRLRGLQVNDAVDFYEEFSGKIWVEALNSQWFVYTKGFNRSQAGIRLKRCFDVVFALLLILLAAPLFVLIGIAIKFDSAGPVLFRQVRVGLHGKTFVIYKFRSMRRNAEFESGPVWTTECDERVTRVGRLLRICR